MPAGGPGELVRLGREDAVLKLYRPIACGAAREFGQAFYALGDELALTGRVGLMGGSIGATVAQLVLAEDDLDISAVLISPVVQLRSVVELMEAQLRFSYPWSAEAEVTSADKAVACSLPASALRGRRALAPRDGARLGG